MSSQEFELKRPWPLLVLAACFLFAPFFNLASALYVGGHPKWFSPMVWWLLFGKLSIPEQLIMASGPMVGVALFYQRKRSWTFAFLLALVTTIYNVFWSPEVQQRGFQILSVINLFGTAGLLGILYFFRFPYLDQRDSLVSGPAKRYQVKIPIFIDGFGSCEIVNLSKTGCYIGGLVNPALKKGAILKLSLNQNLFFEGEIIHLHKGVGLRFIRLTNEAQRVLHDWLRQADQPAHSSAPQSAHK